MISRILTIILLIASGSVIAEDQAVAGLFARKGVEGTIVISSLRSANTIVHNDSRAAHPFPPASTFKILNTLIALEEKAISGKDEVLKWDGHDYEVPDWNKDQTLDTAFKVSCVWCFQDMALRIGRERYKSYLGRAGFGDLREPFEVTTFWLDGSLQASAIEQVALLRKIHQRTLPFSAASYETLRDVMLVEEAPNFTIRAKTGWATRVDPQVGWYVGYVETRDDVWFFATNMEIRSEEDLPLRREITREALKLTGVIE